MPDETPPRDRGPLRTRAVGDIFRGDYVDGYEAKRAAKPTWALEHAALAALLDALPPGLRVLDLPFGTGRFLEEYARRGMRVTGADISADIIDEGRAIRPQLMKHCSIHLGPSCPLPFLDDTFDLAVSFRFLSGIVDAQTAFATLREFRRLAPNAIVQLKCRPPELGPGRPPAPGEKLSKNFPRSQMHELFEPLGWRIAQDRQIDDDPTGNRWAFLLVRA